MRAPSTPSRASRLRSRRVWAVATACLVCAGVLPARGATLFSVVNTGELFGSADQGATWQIRAVLPVRDAAGIVARVTSAELYLVARTGTLYRSIDSGSSWTAVGVVPASDVTDVAVRPDGGILLLAESGAIWLSADQGQSFTVLAALTASDFASLTVGLTGNLYVLTRTGEVSESGNGGQSWVAKGVLTVPDAASIRRFGSNLYVLTRTGSIWRSVDAGATWTAIGTLSQSPLTGFTHDGQRLVVSTREGEVATSPDGASWTWRGGTGQLVVTALGVDVPQATDVLQAASSSRFAMQPPWPNPRRGPGGVTFSFTLPRGEVVWLELFDARGRLVARRPPQPFASAGVHRIVWHLEPVDPGTYFARLRTNDGATAERKWTILR